MGIFNDGWEDEVCRLKAELYTVTVERDHLYELCDQLKQELQALGEKYDALYERTADMHRNPEDAYREDFGDNTIG